jgi:[NiFe] hydrogenase diaphorase moiety large subunit
MTANDVAAVADIVGTFGADPARLLDILEGVQHRFGHVDDEAVAAIARDVGRHPVEVRSTLSFYAFLNSEPRGRYRIRLSKTPVSLIKGAEAVARAFETAVGASLGETSADGLFTVEWTSDIGMGDQEPACLVNGLVLTLLTPADVPGIIEALRGCAREAGGEDDGAHGYPLDAPRALALPNAEVRPSLARAGPLLSGPVEAGAGVKAALAMTPDQVIETVTKARLLGRGGAGFPTGLKWRLTRRAAGSEHYIVCNADEGEPGTFKDRVLLSDFPDLVLDGMTIAGYALGGREGLLYLRGEYAYLRGPLEAQLARRRRDGLLGKAVLGREGFDFDIRLQLGAGAYICGEESSLLDSLEGKRGSPRDRPPFPTDRGYLGQPTAIDNVETLACAARILERGAAWFTDLGTQKSAGTKLMSVSGDCPRPGVYEVPFGVTVNELLDMVGAPEAAFVQVSGPSGQAVAPKDFGRRLAYEDLSTGGSTMVFGPGRDVLAIALQFADFFVDESCGYCTPCRVGTHQLRASMETILAGRATLADIAATRGLAEMVERMSRCGLGQTAPNPILTTMLNFPELYEARLSGADFTPRVSLGEALREAVSVQGREPVPAALEAA